MELTEYLRILWRRRWLIAVAFAAGAALALFFSSRGTPQYSAKAAVLIGPRAVAPSDAAGAFQELLFSREFVGSYAEMLKRLPLAERVVRRLAVPIAPSDLTSHTTTRLVPDTRIIEVTVKDTSPARAERLVNGLVDTFVAQVRQDFGGRGSPVSVLERALRPTSSDGPNPVRDGALGGVFGMMVAVGVAFLLENMDTTLRGAEQVERALAPLPILATIPAFDGGRARGVLIEEDPEGSPAEAFRILRTNVQFLGVERPVRTLLVTSTEADEGKTLVSVNLAAAMAASGLRTCLIEADLRRPVVHENFGLDQSPGLTDVLVGRAELAGVARRSRIPRLAVIPAGPLPPNPAELLGSRRMVDLLEAAKAAADVVIVDAPPVLPVADAGVLSPHVDGVILVVRTGRTKRDVAREAAASLERLGARVLGAVLNGVDGGRYEQYRTRGDRRGAEPRSALDLSEAEVPIAPIEAAARPREGTSGATRAPVVPAAAVPAATAEADSTAVPLHEATDGAGNGLIGKAILSALNKDRNVRNPE